MRGMRKRKKPKSVCRNRPYAGSTAFRGEDFGTAWHSGGGQEYPNWKGLSQQEHYILAVQYLQDAQYPYYPGKEAEGELVELIERNGLDRYDMGYQVDFLLN